MMKNSENDGKIYKSEVESITTRDAEVRDNMRQKMKSWRASGVMTEHLKLLTHTKINLKKF